PPGFHASTPLVIQAGHNEAKGTLFADLDAPKPNDTNAATTKVVASAMVEGKTVTKDVSSLGTLKLGDKPKLFISLEPYREGAVEPYDPARASAAPLEITIHPGQTLPAWLKLHRNGD